MKILILLTCSASAFAAGPVPIPLDASTPFQKVNVKVDAVTFKGRPAIRLTDIAPEGVADEGRLAVLTGTDFENGAIEVDLAGDRTPGSPEAARGFTGMAFHVDPKAIRYEAFYLRPYNGRSQDPEQRNHSTQYVSLPEFGWRKLRTETPGKFESYVDLVPGEWTHVKIEVQGLKAQLYVNRVAQPVLIVNDLKHGPGKGPVALWVGVWAVGHFANLQITKQP